MTEQRLPREINVLRLCEQGLTLKGDLPINKMSRLCPMLTEDTGEVVFELHFGKDAEGLRAITGHIAATVHMNCQRCLAPATFELNDAVALSPVLSEKQVDSLPSHYEPLVVEQDEQSLLDIIEDELILRLPIVPMHDEDSEECLSHETVEAVAEEDESKKDNPFAVLSQLKK